LVVREQVKTPYILTVFSLLFFSGISWAEPIAPWASFSGNSEQAAKLRSISHGCLPNANNIEIEAPPEARVLFVFWAGPRPTCDKSGDISDEPVDTIVFLSPVLSNEVASWYRRKLVELEFYEYVVPPGTDVRCTGTEPRPHETIVFLRAKVNSFCWNYDAYDAPMVTVGPTPQLWRGYGYETVISVYRPAL